MTEQLCANCRSAELLADGSCAHCGWMPLQSTELLFVDDQEIDCPHCGARRSIDEAVCSHCGESAVLESLSPHANTFHISSIMLLTALIAVCLALGNLSPEIGLIAIVATTLVVLRMLVLTHERKRHRYPPSTLKEVAQLLMTGYTGLFLAALAGGACAFMGGLALIPIVHAIPFRHGPFWFFVFLGMTHVPVLLRVWLKEGNHRVILAAFAASSIAAIAMLGFYTTFDSWYRYWYAPAAPYLLACIPVIWLACRRGGAAKARSFAIGFMSGNVGDES